jgi:hypothetical protein
MLAMLSNMKVNAGTKKKPGPESGLCVDLELID